MISEDHETETWRNEAENSALPSKENYIQIENDNIPQYYNITNQINAALECRRDFFI